MDGIWTEIETAFDAGNADDRIQLFKSLKEVAPYRPVRVLRLVRRSTENEAVPVQLLPDWQHTQEHVLREIPALLRAIAFHLVHVQDAAEILWRLAQGDRRPEHQYPDHARRVLEEMAEYGRSKPPQFNEWMSDFAARLSRAPRTFDGTFTPLNIIDKLLVKEGEFTESEGYTVSFGGFGLRYATVKPIRDKALKVIQDCLDSENSRAAIRATESISRVLSGLLPAVGRAISEEEFKWQTAERIAVLEIVENRLKKPAPTALVRQIRSVLRRSRPQTSDNPVSEKIYCKDDDRREAYAQEKFDFLGYTFRPRGSKSRKGKYFINFSPAISEKASKAIRRAIRKWKLHMRSDSSLEDLSRMFNPIIRGWIQYYGGFTARGFIRSCNT